MTTLLSTTAFIGQMGYQKASDRTLKTVTRKKANWFERNKTSAVRKEK